MVRIPDHKRYFRIGEASSILGVEPYVLRYWESEFPQLKPRRADSKQRTYQKQDLEILMEIKRLLYEEKMTIQGARRRLNELKTSKTDMTRQLLQTIRSDLLEILDLMT